MNNEMNLKDKYREETNKDVYSDGNLYGCSGGSYSDQYVKWLEKQVKNNSAQQRNKNQREEMKKMLILFAVIGSLLACGDNANTKVEVSNATSKLVDGVKVYSGFSFTLYAICIDSVEYVANSKGGLVKHGDCR